MKRECKAELEFEDLPAIIKESVGQNLKLNVSQARGRCTGKPTITANFTALVFPQIINISKAFKRYSARKYVFPYYQYTDQLSVNTRAFLSLCAQAGTTGRKVVKPSVKQTRLRSDDSWLPLDTYYDVKYLESLLASSGYAELVEKMEYLKECPPNSPDHVSVHFIDNSEASMGFTKANLRLEKGFYNDIVKNTSRKGWTECEFLDRAMAKTPGKQYCVNGDIIQDWKVFERDVAKNEKCLNIFVWRGVEGPTYRLKFSEDRMKYSSTDLALALKPGQPVMEEVERFQNEILSQNYIAVYIRSEFMLREFSISYLRDCIQLVLQALFALKRITGLSRVYVATDMGEYGSSWLVRFRSKNHYHENFFKDIHDDVVKQSQGVTYRPPSNVVDRGIIAMVDLTLLSRARHLISAGPGTFRETVAAKFLENRRSDKQTLSQITVCADYKTSD
ncbi:uncharacterized protein LOC114531324 [Dendronephthya gigantea]|uniref:uncharacterized protein LOC114531324 n=1 Tax=Dendronephthya gigantea TaxID=151771 RepID=UPI00106AF0B7|nr:uncharacterized protein LOC114531324 [Dendronephthya gigantea]